MRKFKMFLLLLIFFSVSMGATDFHHIYPQEFNTFFQKKGIDIHEKTIMLQGGYEHQGIIHNKLDYNKEWGNFIKKNPRANKRSIEKFAEKKLKAISKATGRKTINFYDYRTKNYSGTSYNSDFGMLSGTMAYKAGSLDNTLTNFKYAIKNPTYWHGISENIIVGGAALAVSILTKFTFDFNYLKFGKIIAWIIAGIQIGLIILSVFSVNPLFAAIASIFSAFSVLWYGYNFFIATLFCIPLSFLLLVSPILVIAIAIAIFAIGFQVFGD